MDRYNGWSLETLGNEGGIKERDVLDNETKLTVSQYFNRILKSPLYSDLPTWLNRKLGGYGPKTFRAPQGREKFLDPL